MCFCTFISGVIGEYSDVICELRGVENEDSVLMS